MSISVTGYRYEYDDNADKGMYLSMSIPRSDSSTVTYNGSYGSGSDSSRVGYFKRVDDATHYRVNVGTSEQHGSVDGYLSHDGSLAKVDPAPTTMKGNTVRRGSPYRGGNADRAWWALHCTQNMGGTRLLIDADGIANVPVESNGAPVYTTYVWQGGGRRY